MRTFMLIHRHRPTECRVAYAAWRTFDTPLRGQIAQSTCGRSRPGVLDDNAVTEELHELWCTVRAADPAAALAQLPPFIAERTDVREVSEVLVG
jgi:hypothetical protein